MEFQNLDDLKKLRVVDLKERLAKLGKSTSGLKADLVDRLYNALAEKAGQVDLSAAAPSYVQMCNMSSMEPEPPVVEVTIDTSQFDMSVQEPQIVTMGQYNVIDNVPDMNAELDQEQAYYQRQEETERLRQQQEELWRQQQREEQLHRQQEAERYHQQQEFQRLELERIQREEEEAERLRLMQEEEMELRRQQEEEMELRRQQEEMELRRQQEEMELRRQQEEEMRRQQEEEMRRQQQEEEMLRRQQEEEMRRIQEEKELERQEEERRRIMEEDYRRRQEEEYRMRQEEEMRRKYEEDLDRQREQQELERHLEMERRQLELERQRELDLEKQRELELEKQRELELEKQRKLELEKQRELELERQRQIEYERLEMERLRELELERERELELERQREQRQRELEQIELERQKEIELLTMREMERQRELQAEKMKELEKEKERQRQLERELERQRKLEAEEAEQKRLYELELQRKAEEERMHALYEEEVRRDRDEQMRQQEEFQRRQQEEAWRKEQEEAELRQSLIAESEANREKEMEEEYENDINNSAPIQQEADSVVNSYSASVITHTGTPMDLSATRVVVPEPTDNGTEDSHSQESESGDADKSLETVNNEKNKENLVSETNQNEEAVNKRGPRTPKVKLTKSEKRKLKKKRRQQNRREHVSRSLANLDDEAEGAEPDVEVQYVGDKVDLNPTDPMYHHFMKIFEAFKLTDPEQAKREAEEAAARAKLEAKKEPDLRKKPKDADEEPELEPKKDEQPKLSKRKLKQLTRLSIAELKQHVNRPDVVEMHDVTAKDPKLLVLLKSTRNTVPVPRHWCFKRKFLQGKRGIEKPPFNLPDFIKKTGIMEMRQALQEKEDQKTLKAKMREKVRPKMGKIDIDYQKLHDAFFKWQTKPRMTIHGDLYYEGKEYETRLKEKKPGELSDDLRTALGMPVGPGCQKIPPPWLIAMQRYGPPPSYPNLKIPGLNSPIPDSCSFGYHAGGWGKPPVDEMGRPLYGDVFGTTGSDYQQSMPEEEVDRSHWGELESESESESEPEEEEEEPGENEEDIDKEGLVTPADGGLATPSGLSSVSMGMETPDMIELRKRKIENEMETSGENPSLYTILPEKKTDRLGGVMMGSTHVYDITAAMPAKVRTSASHGGDGGVDVALDPSELDMDTATMTARYEQTLREQRSQLEKEDLSDMVAEHTAKQKNKRKRAAGQEINRSGKKYKDFKF